MLLLLIMYWNMSSTPVVTVWNEYQHEKINSEVAKTYPNGIHGAIAQHLQSVGLLVQTATLDQPEHGLTSDVLERTDVLIWWGHIAHDKVQDDIVDKIHQRVLSGMGLIALHSSHFSKIFKRLMGTSCNLKYRATGEKERIWVVDPAHPIASGLNECFEIPTEEMYGEFFDIPHPDALVLISWFEGGEVFRSGCCFHRGKGKIFYFRPGDQAFPTYHQPEVLQVITNAVFWANPTQPPDIQFGKRLLK
ncbi:ThuA domain-containing protein [Aerosakkonemataceae cyanobacterium BLCC-F154]|uniref:ThuA domain-containing protein n=2 Tax=Floridanema TaxID=3396149 RepID=A0ABV4YAJ6_9CYAN